MLSSGGTERGSVSFGTENSRHAGRPRLPKGLRALIIAMAQENPSWAKDRLQTSCLSLGLLVDSRTVGK